MAIESELVRDLDFNDVVEVFSRARKRVIGQGGLRVIHTYYTISF